MSIKKKLSNIRLPAASIPAVIYAILCTVMLIIVSNFVDLPYLFGNWEVKAKSILSFSLIDNFYPPGAAIALIPFLWAGPEYTICVFFYYFLSCYVYGRICEIIKNSNYKTLALLALPLNPYLSWLCLTSTDQVVELFFLMLFSYGLIKRNIKLFLFFGWLLCLTRPAYWVAFLLISIVYPYSGAKVRQFLQFRRFLGLTLLIITMLGNLSVFGSPNLSSSSGLTFHYSHNKYHYLSLPLFDMDVFLDNQMDPIKTNQQSPYFAYVKDEHLRAGLVSIRENPREFILATGQKFNSYFFSIQKVPNLPGDYRISSDAKNIIIGEERKSWSLILGNTFYEIYRMIWLLCFIVACVYLISSKKILSFSNKQELNLLVPYFAGVIPALIFYVETRQKICSELIAVPVILKILNEFKIKVQKN